MSFVASPSASEQPFGWRPRPELHVPIRSHEGAWKVLRSVIAKGEGVVVVTGEPGMGKTLMLLRAREILPSNLESAFITHPAEEPREFLAQLILAIGGGAEHVEQFLAEPGLEGMIAVLEQRLAGGRRLMLMVDDAHHLSEPHLAWLAHLASFRLEERNPVVMLLSGRREVLDLLATPEGEFLRERVSGVADLPPLTWRESRDYVEALHAKLQGKVLDLTWSGWLHLLLLSRGVPRNINLIVRKSLVGREGRRRVTGAAVLRAMGASTAHGAIWRVGGPLPWMAGAGGALALLGFLAGTGSPPSDAPSRVSGPQTVSLDITPKSEGKGGKEGAAGADNGAKPPSAASSAKVATGVSSPVKAVAPVAPPSKTPAATPPLGARTIPLPVPPPEKGGGSSVSRPEIKPALAPKEAKEEPVVATKGERWERSAEPVKASPPTPVKAVAPVKSEPPSPAPAAKSPEGKTGEGKSGEGKSGEGKSGEGKAELAPLMAPSPVRIDAAALAAKSAPPVKPPEPAGETKPVPPPPVPPPVETKPVAAPPPPVAPKETKPVAAPSPEPPAAAPPGAGKVAQEYAVTPEMRRGSNATGEVHRPLEQAVSPEDLRYAEKTADAPRKLVVGEVYHVVQTGSYTKRINAEGVAQRLRKLGYAAYVYQIVRFERSFYAVRLNFSQRQAAEKAAEALRAKEPDLQTLVIELSRD
ncbi:MAG: AAA family ATPase [Magnetococcales bacterium]|nr:AAA family ATPase [Magnetococcales bacterium]